jgi:hypothetical protein
MAERLIYRSGTSHTVLFSSTLWKPDFMLTGGAAAKVRFPSNLAGRCVGCSLNTTWTADSEHTGRHGSRHHGGLTQSSTISRTFLCLLQLDIDILSSVESLDPGCVDPSVSLRLGPGGKALGCVQSLATQCSIFIHSTMPVRKPEFLAQQRDNQTLRKPVVLRPPSSSVRQIHLPLFGHIERG